VKLGKERLYNNVASPSVVKAAESASRKQELKVAKKAAAFKPAHAEPKAKVSQPKAKVAQPAKKAAALKPAHAVPKAKVAQPK